MDALQQEFSLLEQIVSKLWFFVKEVRMTTIRELIKVKLKKEISQLTDLDTPLKYIQELIAAKQLYFFLTCTKEISFLNKVKKQRSFDNWKQLKFFTERELKKSHKQIVKRRSTFDGAIKAYTKQTSLSRYLSTGRKHLISLRRLEELMPWVR